MSTEIPKSVAEPVAGRFIDAESIVSSEEAPVAVSMQVPFDKVRDILESSPQPVRPKRSTPRDSSTYPSVKGTPTNSKLRELAKKYKPPQEWLEGEEEQLF